MLQRVYGSMGVWGCAGQSTADEMEIYRGASLRVVMPVYSLAAGSVKILALQNQISNEREVYTVIQQIVGHWSNKGITDYMIFGKEDSRVDGGQFTREIIPYAKKGWRFWQQVKVLWNVACGGLFSSPLDREKVATELRGALSTLQQGSHEKKEAEIVGRDAFCRENVIKRQLVFEDRHVRLLYNHAPVAPGGLHFLITPKVHHVGFSHLTPDEYVESVEIERKLIAFYQKKGYPLVYHFNKTGARAGQTEAHWHEHVIFVASEIQAAIGLCKVFVKTLMPCYDFSRLSPKELAGRVITLQTTLQGVLGA